MNNTDKEYKNQLTYAIGLGAIGFILFGITVSWWGSIAIFLMLWGNNISESLAAERRARQTIQNTVVFDSISRAQPLSRGENDSDR